MSLVALWLGPYGPPSEADRSRLLSRVAPNLFCRTWPAGLSHWNAPETANRALEGMRRDLVQSHAATP